MTTLPNNKTRKRTRANFNNNNNNNNNKNNNNKNNKNNTQPQKKKRKIPQKKKRKIIYKITNMREINFSLSPAEYVKKKKKGLPNMTKTHGLGSGIYGIILNENEEENASRPKSSYTYSDHILHNPVVLDTDDKRVKFTKLSRWLMKLCETKRSAEVQEYRRTEESEYEEIRKELCPKSNELIYAVSTFRRNYNSSNPGDFVHQPINYLLGPHYDGVYNSTMIGNTFNLGSVLYIKDSNDLNYQNLTPRHQKYAFDPPARLVEGKSLSGGKIKMRKSPQKPAKYYKLNTIQKGVDKKKWICAKRKNNVKYWKKI